jgi:PAS domain S-box-containing protein
VGRNLLEDSSIQGIVINYQDVTDRKQAEDALRESQGKMASIFENSPDILMNVDPEGTITFINHTASGYTIEETLGTKVYDYIQPEYHDAYRVAIKRAFETGDGGSLEFVGAGPEGRVSWYQTRFGSIKQEGKIVAVLLVATDITERKITENRLRDSLKEKEVLLKELHHRVKNNLQIITSLLSLQSKYVKDKRALQMFEDTQNRVMSMAIFHEKLYLSEDLARIDFADYVRSMMSDLFSYHGIPLDRIQLDIADVGLGVDTAIPCGLIINELVSNSLKHAFPKGRKGKILVRLQPDDGGGFVLTVSDDGVGLPKGLDMAATESLGLQLVGALVRQMGGSMEVARSGGTAFVIHFSDVKEKALGSVQ